MKLGRSLILLVLSLSFSVKSFAESKILTSPEFETNEMDWLEGFSAVEFACEDPTPPSSLICYDKQAVLKRKAYSCRKNPNEKHCCYSAVKSKLLQMGLVDHRLGGLHGYLAARELKKEGWKEKTCNARKNPTLGMVCSYRGYTDGHGHAEVWSRCPKTNKLGWYYGISCKPQPLKLGCFSCKVKPSHAQAKSQRAIHNRVARRDNSRFI